MLNHGGRLITAAQEYNIPVADWLDLSTGINPNGYPIPDIPSHYWQRLPEDQDALLSTAQHYYQCEPLLAVAGSQAAIQSLPLLQSTGTVGCLSPSYNEHPHAWQKAGHKITLLENITAIDHAIAHLNTLILVNPNNPSGLYFSIEQCLAWLKILQKKKGWLIIDEAFIDCTPHLSLSHLIPLKGLIILRSTGKFFGLAGARTGFILAEASILNNLQEHLGPWSISNPSRYITRCALQDSDWQATTRLHLPQQSQRLKNLLTQYALPPTQGTALFQWLKTPNAKKIHILLAQQGIFTRLFTQPDSIRFGLPANESQWQQLIHGLKIITPNLSTPNLNNPL